MYDIITPLQNSTVLTDCYHMDWCDCNLMDWREHSIGPFVHNLMIDFKYGIFHIQIRSMNLPMVMWWVMFCEIIPHILASWFPINKKIFLFYPVLHPMKIRFYWMKDRVKQKDFCVYCKPGSQNMGNYFTKHHPPHHHR